MCEELILEPNDNLLIDKLQNSTIRSNFIEETMSIKTYLNDNNYFVEPTDHSGVYEWSIDANNKMLATKCNDVEMGTYCTDTNPKFYTYGPEDFVKFVTINSKTQNKFFLPIKVNKFNDTINLLLMFSNFKYVVNNTYTRTKNIVIIVGHGKKSGLANQTVNLIHYFMNKFFSHLNSSIGYKYEMRNLSNSGSYYSDLWWNIYIITRKSTIHDKYVKYLITAMDIYKLSQDEIYELYNEIAEMKLNIINNVPDQLVSYCDMMKHKKHLDLIIPRNNIDFVAIIDNYMTNIKKITIKWTDDFDDRLI